MELRQLRYFVKIVDLNSMGKAAVEFGVATSALSQQINKLESELGVSLLQRRSNGTTPTEAGLMFYRSAQLILRHADDAVSLAQRSRMTGHVSIGLTPATTTVLAVPLFLAMKERYPGVELHFVESFSGYLSQMLNARQLDLAVLFEAEVANDWTVMPLLKESLFAICSPASAHAFSGAGVRLEDLANVPLILPSKRHGLRRMLDAAFSQRGVIPLVVAEVDSLLMLMELVRIGYGVTIQQSAVAARSPIAGLNFVRLEDTDIGLQNMLVSLSEKELSPTALASRVVVKEVTATLVKEGKWIGAALSNA
jgi:LysR family tcuABC transcriptional regulator